MKRFLFSAGSMLLVASLVILSVWAFKHVLVLEEAPGGGDPQAIRMYRAIQYGVIGLIGVLLSVTGFYYRRERMGPAGGEQEGVPVKAGVMGWKAWAAILVFLGGIFGGGIYFLSGETYFKGKEAEYAVRTKSGEIVFRGTLEEVKQFMAEKKQNSGNPAAD